MLEFFVLSLFPEQVFSAVNHSMIKRAMEAGIIKLNLINIRDFTTNKHKQADDYPYGGGAGMVMMAQPVYDAFLSVKPNISENTPVIYMSPQGKRFEQGDACKIAESEKVVILCGHYEGIDQRVIDEIVTHEISIGDYILTGGELAAAIIIDSASRLVPGVLNKEHSHIEESFSRPLLEYPHYTRPPVWLGKNVPDVLLSGHHKKIEDWRMEQSLLRTKARRPDLLGK